MKNTELLEELRKAVKEGRIKVHTNLHGYIQLINVETGEKMMDKLISQQAAVDALKELTANGTNRGMVFGEDAVHRIEILPSAQPEHCEDAVSREAVLSMIDTYMNKSVELHYLPTSDGIKKLISILPPAKPERPKGRWIPTASGKGRHECSRCHEYAPCYQDGSEHLSTFCVLCGAKMERGEEE